jgi:hypothetical protein
MTQNFDSGSRRAVYTGSFFAASTKLVDGLVNVKSVSQNFNRDPQGSAPPVAPPQPSTINDQPSTFLGCPPQQLSRNVFATTDANDAIPENTT